MTDISTAEWRVREAAERRTIAEKDGDRDYFRSETGNDDAQILADSYLAAAAERERMEQQRREMIEAGDALADRLLVRGKQADDYRTIAGELAASLREHHPCGAVIGDCSAADALARFEAMG